MNKTHKTQQIENTIEALVILSEYVSNNDRAIFAEGSTLNVRVDNEVRLNHMTRLEELGFFFDDEIGCFYSFLDNGV